MPGRDTSGPSEGGAGPAEAGFGVVLSERVPFHKFRGFIVFHYRRECLKRVGMWQGAVFRQCAKRSTVFDLVKLRVRRRRQIADRQTDRQTDRQRNARPKPRTTRQPTRWLERRAVKRAHS